MYFGQNGLIQLGKSHKKEKEPTGKQTERSRGMKARLNQRQTSFRSGEIKHVPKNKHVLNINLACLFVHRYQIAAGGGRARGGQLG